MEIGKMLVRKKDKGYQYVIPVKKNKSWTQISKQGFKTAKEARAAGNERIKELLEEVPKPVQSEDITFGKAAKLLEREGNKALATKAAYSAWASVFDAISEKPVQDVTYQDVADIIFKYRETHTHETTVQVKKHGSRIMKHAIKKLKATTYDPFEDLELKAPTLSEKSEKTALTPSQINALLDCLTGYEKLLTAFMALCGLRISEARGLTRAAIHDGKLSVFQQRTDKELKSTLKTKNSYRDVPIPKRLMDLYQEYPAPIKEDGLIFKKLIYSKTITSHYEKAGFSITPHELRHSYTTNCISAGIDYKTTAALIGDSVEMVYKVYSHVNADMMDRAAKLLEGF